MKIFPNPINFATVVNLFNEDIDYAFISYSDKLNIYNLDLWVKTTEEIGDKFSVIYGDGIDYLKRYIPEQSFDANVINLPPMYILNINTFRELGISSNESLVLQKISQIKPFIHIPEIIFYEKD